YQIPLTVEKPGAYKLELRFSVPVIQAGADRALQFWIPPLARSRLMLDFPKQARNVQCLASLGLSRVTHNVGSGSSQAASRLEVEVGHVDQLHVHWRQQEKAANRAKTAVQIRETYFWDLRGPETILSGILNYQVIQG